MNEAQQESDDQYHTFDDFRETVPETSTVDSTFNAISGCQSLMKMPNKSEKPNR